MKKIKDVIKLSGLSRRTLQYYDDMGLVENKRSAGNYRLYRDEDLERVWQIILYKEMGFHLEEIRKILAADKSRAEDLLKSRADSIRYEISELERTLAFIERVLDCGIPDMETEVAQFDNVTLVDMASRLSKRL